MSEPVDPGATIVLREYTPAFVTDLADADLAYLSRLRERIVITRAFDQPGYLIDPRSYVGVLMLPSGRRVECRPKVPIENFFAMLAVAFDLDPAFYDEIAPFQRIDEVFEFVIRYFAELVDRRIRDGLYRNYRETAENLGVVRGRIDFARDVRLNAIQRHRTFCRFTEFTWDIPENQVVRQVAHGVRHWVTQPDLRGELLRIDRMLGEVTPTQHPASLLDRFTYHRLNDDYRPIHNLCRLFLEGATLSEDEGLFEFRTFLFDMNALFERFVFKAMERRMPRGMSLHEQWRRYLDRDRRVKIRPDLVAFRQQSPVLIADTKYIVPREGEPHHSALYQVLAYCTALEVRHGALIYPRHTFDVDDIVRIAGSPVEIRRLSIDLRGSRAALERATDAVTQTLIAWTDSAPIPLVRIA
jgi:5-methylcytosine-specific restriction enzyme subunit McrC